jgi:hypothetical protein
MTFYKWFQQGRQRVTGKIESAHDLLRDIFRSIVGPPLGGIECVSQRNRHQGNLSTNLANVPAQKNGVRSFGSSRQNAKFEKRFS